MMIKLGLNDGSGMGADSDWKEESAIFLRRNGT